MDTSSSDYTDLAQKSLADILVGESAVLERVISAEAVEAFAALSGDRNPLHLDDGFARETGFRRPVAHGMLVGSLVSTLIGMKLPGPGALWTQHSFRWLTPVFVGDSIRVVLRVVHKSVSTRTIKVEVVATNQQGIKVMEGEGVVVMTERQKHGGGSTASERVALVTGGSGGIGAAIVRALATAGSALAVAYLSRADKAEGLCREVANDRVRALPVHLDVRDEGSVRAAIRTIAAEFGKPVNVLVNNASPAWTAKPVSDLSWSDIDEMINVELRGAFHCSQAVIQGMIEAEGGSIVNIGSVFAEDVPPVGWSAHVMAKSALRAFTRSLAAEYGPKGIRVNMVSPGMIGADSAAPVSERLKKVQAMQTPLRRLCAPEDVAGTVAFLCSNAGAFLTGLDIPICGGSRM